MDFAKKIPPVVLVCAAFLFSAEDIVNYASPITVSDFLAVGDTLWAASSGGLAAHNLRGGGKTLISSAKIFPDPYLTALCRDSRGNIWIGSRRGYLYRRTPRGQFTLFQNYKYSGWGITSLFAHGETLVVGSDRGVSLFDTERGVAVRNATGIGTFKDPRVNAISAFKDTLFLGCEEGVAYLDGLDAVPLGQRNFYDPGIWKIREGQGGPASSFVNSGSYVRAYSVPSAVFRGRLFIAADSGYSFTRADSLDRGLRWIRWGNDSLDSKKVVYSGRILKLYNEDDNRLWIGTDERFYYSYNGESEPEQHGIEGLALRKVSRVAAAQNGDAWVLPVASYPNAWHEGIYRYDGGRWHTYGSSTHGEIFGYAGEHHVAGAAFGRDGTFWAGMSGGNIKHIDPVRNTVGQLIVGNAGFVNVAYYDNVPAEDGYWGKSDALAVDSSGYLWASVWKHDMGNLICYDSRYMPAPWEPNPVKAHYRWFFNEPPLKTENITELCVDADNRIFAYDLMQNRLTVFSYGGSPLADGIKVDTSYLSFGTVAAVRAAPDGGVYIADTRGLAKVSAGSLKVEPVDNTITNVSDLAVQGNVLWFGTSSGVLRYNIDKKEKRYIGEAEGLPSDNVTSLSVDGKNGYLWVVTENVVSRVNIGRQNEIVSKEAVRVFPNVFSISGRAQGATAVTFARLEQRSTVSVYAVNGALVARVGSEYFTENEWRAAWTPRRNLAPGTYIAVIRPSGKRAKILLKP